MPKNKQPGETQLLHNFEPYFKGRGIEERFRKGAHASPTVTFMEQLAPHLPSCERCQGAHCQTSCLIKVDKDNKYMPFKNTEELKSSAGKIHDKILFVERHHFEIL